MPGIGGRAAKGALIGVDAFMVALVLASGLLAQHDPQTTP